MYQINTLPHAVNNLMKQSIYRPINLIKYMTERISARASTRLWPLENLRDSAVATSPERLLGLNLIFETSSSNNRHTPVFVVKGNPEKSKPKPDLGRRYLRETLYSEQS